jgi:hypothetical protein
MQQIQLATVHRKIRGLIFKRPPFLLRRLLERLQYLALLQAYRLRLQIQTMAVQLQVIPQFLTPAVYLQQAQHRPFQFRGFLGLQLIPLPSMPQIQLVTAHHQVHPIL